MMDDQSHAIWRIVVRVTVLWMIVLILGLPAISWSSKTPPGTFLGLKVFSTLMTAHSVTVVYAYLSWTKRLLVTPVVALAIPAVLWMWLRLP